MLQQHLLLALYWIIFCGLHSALATSKSKAWFSKKSPSLFKYYRFFYTVFAALSLAAVIIFQLDMETPLLYKPPLIIRLICGLVLATGAIIMIICIRKYFLNLSGVKSLYTENESGNQLRIEGVHKYVRHPLYIGTFLTIWGAAGLFPYLSFFIANAIITFYTVYAIKWEEQKLVTEFGDDYKRYSTSVPKLLPRIK